ncbi:c-type cytochrome [Gemmobacter denitrificans]|uniref:Cytochrome c n=1 Tax=Gemmobacter denitrificans TaxID=3123040 RepID=A0ABU8C187_9RHOB
MKTFSRLMIVASAFAATMAFAEGEAADPTVKARQDLMKTVGANTKILGEMAGDKAPFDAAAAEAAKAALVAASAEIAAKFEPQATDPATEAKPEIWTNWDDFVAKAGALNSAAQALDATSLDGVKAGMAGVGGACKACHTAYRI